MAAPSTTASAERTKLSARERLLASADELFYEHGINTVGIDRVIEHAGVAKASLYNTFGSKDELVRAYLHGRHARRQESILAAIARVESPRDKVLAVFDRLATIVGTSGFHGCAFINASGEAEPGSVVEQVSQEYRAWVRTLFVDLLTQAGASDPEGLAVMLQLLYDGVAISARMDAHSGDVSAALAARRGAEQLLNAAL